MGLIHARREEVRSAREARARGSDAGVSQSAFVGALAALTILIAMLIVPFAPRIGIPIAQQWICQLLSDMNKAGADPTGKQMQGQSDTGKSMGGQGICGGAQPDPLPPPGAGPAVVPVVFQGMDRGQIERMVDDLFEGRSICEWVNSNLENFEVGARMPDSGPEGGPCPLQVNITDDGVRIEVPEGEVHADGWSTWWIHIAAGALAGLAGLSMMAVCGAVVKIARVCTPLAAFAGTFTWILMAGIFSGQSITDATLWANAAIGGLMAGLTTALMEAGLSKWALEGGLGKVLRSIGNSIKTGAANFKTWFGGKVEEWGANISDAFNQAANYMDRKFRDFFDSRGPGLFGIPGPRWVPFGP